MNRILVVCMCAMLALASSALAAQVSFLSSDAATSPLNWVATYANGDYFIWDYSSGKPDWKDAQGKMKDPPYQSNPAYVKEFKYNWTSGSSGGGGGSGGGTSSDIKGHVYYDLTLNAGKSFEFLVGFWDDEYGQTEGLQTTDVALRVQLVGANLSPADTEHDILVSDLRHGIVLKWDVTLPADEKLTLDVAWVNGEGTGAAAFFLNNVRDAGQVPEPATVGLVLFGLAGVFVRRSRK